MSYSYAAMEVSAARLNDATAAVEPQGLRGMQAYKYESDLEIQDKS